MPVSLEAMMADLSAEDRAEVERGAIEIVVQNRTLTEVRKSRKITQAQLAGMLGTSQANVSKIEQQTDILFSTANRIATVLGGKAKLVFEFPKGASVVLDMQKLARGGSVLTRHTKTEGFEEAVAAKKASAHPEPKAKAADKSAPATAKSGAIKRAGTKAETSRLKRAG
jgi:transcriptional regulator with XRE-family HTH domain